MAEPEIPKNWIPFQGDPEIAILVEKFLNEKRSLWRCANIKKYPAASAAVVDVFAAVF